MPRGSLGTADLATSAVTTANVASGSITRAKLAATGLGSLIGNCAASDGSLQFHNSSGANETVSSALGDLTNVAQLENAMTSSLSGGRFIADQVTGRRRLKPLIILFDSS